MELSKNDMLELLYSLRIAREKVFIAFTLDEYDEYDVHKDEAHEAIENLKKVLGEIK